MLQTRNYEIPIETMGTTLGAKLHFKYCYFRSKLLSSLHIQNKLMPLKVECALLCWQDIQRHFCFAVNKTYVILENRCVFNNILYYFHLMVFAKVSWQLLFSPYLISSLVLLCSSVYLTGNSSFVVLTNISKYNANRPRTVDCLK